MPSWPTELDDNPSLPPETSLLPSQPLPLGAHATLTHTLQISSITAEDVRAFLAKWERPDAAVLGIVGDFDPRQVKKEKQLASGRGLKSLARDGQPLRAVPGQLPRQVHAPVPRLTPWPPGPAPRPPPTAHPCKRLLFCSLGQAPS